jgi:hypothetical protein
MSINDSCTLYVKKYIVDNFQNTHNSVLRKKALSSIDKIMLDYNHLEINPRYKREIEKYLCFRYSSFWCVYNPKSDISTLFKWKQGKTLIHDEYCFYKFLERTWTIMNNSPHKIELRKRFREEIKESRKKCFTGLVHRIVNTFSGFHPEIGITISVENILCDEIVKIKIMNHDKRNKNVYNKACYDQTKQLLERYDIPEDEWEHWLDPFC